MGKFLWKYWKVRPIDNRCPMLFGAMWCIMQLIVLMIHNHALYHVMHDSILWHILWYTMSYVSYDTWCRMCHMIHDAVCAIRYMMPKVPYDTWCRVCHMIHDAECAIWYMMPKVPYDTWYRRCHMISIPFDTKSDTIHANLGHC